jgi:16S rRNA A1518/A1519 N6-dimethyltransferase RsmA/KsgA/DIM1 with predicted DNA glycosylase/AP lyase activity
MLRGSLSEVLEDPAGVFAATGIDPTARPEQLEPADFLALAEEAG